MTASDDFDARATMEREFPIAFVLGCIYEGHIEAKGRTADQIVAEGFAEMKNLAMSGVVPGVIFDYQRGIQEEAERYSAAGRYEYAVMFYATWIEHWLNSTLSWACTRKDLHADYAKSVVKGSIWDKTGYLWFLLLESAFPDDFRRDINLVATHRNQFVHYKWPSFLPGEERRDAANVAEIGAALIQQLTALENEIIFDGRLDEIRRAIAAAEADYLERSDQTRLSSSSHS